MNPRQTPLRCGVSFSEFDTPPHPASCGSWPTAQFLENPRISVNPLLSPRTCGRRNHLEAASNIEVSVEGLGGSTAWNSRSTLSVGDQSHRPGAGPRKASGTVAAVVASAFSPPTYHVRPIASCHDDVLAGLAGEAASLVPRGWHLRRNSFRPQAARGRPRRCRRSAGCPIRRPPTARVRARWWSCAGNRTSVKVTGV